MQQFRHVYAHLFLVSNTELYVATLKVSASMEMSVFHTEYVESVVMLQSHYCLNSWSLLCALSMRLLHVNPLTPELNPPAQR
jgi:hypothetical protein